jgi:hypothetical protein
MKHFLKLYLFLWAGLANAAVINFESGLDPLFNYTGVSTLTTPWSPNTGYDAVGTFSGSPQVAFNNSAASLTTFSWAGSGATFDLNSFIIAGSWGSQTLTIEGVLNNSVVHSVQLAVDNNQVDIFNPDWQGIDAFRIMTGNDYIADPSLASSGQHWALDNLKVNEAVSQVPAPAAIWLLGSGLIGLIGMRKKSVNLSSNYA